MGGFERRTVELSTTRGRRPIAEWITLHRPSRLDPPDITILGPMKVTTPTRTIADLCGVLERDRVEPALDDALRRGLTSLPRLRWTAERLGGKGRPGARLLAELLAERGHGWVPSASRFEARLSALVTRSGLPEPAIQHEIRDGGALLARVDFAYPDLKLAIEADGYRCHSGRVAWQRDLARRNTLTARGWRVLHVTWDDIRTRPDEVIANIQAGLEVSSTSP
jgi:hypothetical protein